MNQAHKAAQLRRNQARKDRILAARIAAQEAKKAREKQNQIIRLGGEGESSRQEAQS